MIKDFIVRRRFEVPPEVAWNLLTDTTQWPRWGPSVKGVTCSDRFVRKGSDGFVRTAIGLTLRFVITDYVPGRFWKWAVAGFTATGHRLTPCGACACIVAFEVPMAWLPYGIVCNLALRRIDRILEV